MNTPEIGLGITLMRCPMDPRFLWLWAEVDMNPWNHGTTLGPYLGVTDDFGDVVPSNYPKPTYLPKE